MLPHKFKKCLSRQSQTRSEAVSNRRLGEQSLPKIRRSVPWAALLSIMLVSFMVHVSAADEWDPQDNTGATAPLIVPGSTSQIHGPHTLDASDTNDWFKVSLTAGVPCQLESSGLLDTKAFLYSDEAGNIEVAQDDQNGAENNFMLRYLAHTNATYYLKVQEFVAGEGGTYTLHYGFYSADEWDPMDNAGTNEAVTEVSMGEAAKIHGPHVLNQFDHYDWFRIHLSAGTVYRFESIGDSDTYGAIYIDPDDETAADQNDDDGVDSNFQLDYSPPVTTEYYLEVRHFAVGNDAEYDLRYYIPAKDSDADQLLDAWEIKYFDGLTYGPVVPPGDTDRYSNLEEYIAGTDPTDPGSFFTVNNGLAGSSFVVKWVPLSGREYRVYWAENLTNDFTQTGPVIDHPQSNYTDTAHSTFPSGFYKIDVRLK